MRRVALTCVVFALSGCGGEDDKPARTAPAPGPRVLVAALGDSITAGSPLWDPNPRFRALIGSPDPRSQWEYWARKRLGERVRFRNCGRAGDRTDQIRARLDACARGADVLVVQGGVNDIGQGRPVPDIAGDLRAMIRRGRELGLDVAIANVLPWSNGHPELTRPIERLNDEIAAMAEAEGVPLVDFHEAIEDPDRPGRMRPDWTVEGDHPSVEGYRRLGEVFELPQ